MTTFRVFESCTGQLVARVQAHSMADAIAQVAADLGRAVEHFHALVDVGPAKADPAP
jgi:hypothetical protein